ncbi:hypothetical protein NQZ68_031020 [Dissostichus eleginoides]|nr:hypothetical protein NQZ68_031020 [Dissostichus eleginoides]
MLHSGAGHHDTPHLSALNASDGGYLSSVTSRSHGSPLCGRHTAERDILLTLVAWLKSVSVKTREKQWRREERLLRIWNEIRLTDWTPKEPQKFDSLTWNISRPPIGEQWNQPWTAIGGKERKVGPGRSAVRSPAVAEMRKSSPVSHDSQH